jgi:hypothetical protein
MEGDWSLIEDIPGLLDELKSVPSPLPPSVPGSAPPGRAQMSSPARAGAAKVHFSKFELFTWLIKLVVHLGHTSRNGAILGKWDQIRHQPFTPTTP